MVVDLYERTADEPCVIKGEILRRIIEVSNNNNTTVIQQQIYDILNCRSKYQCKTYKYI